ncbi:hypothetical protein CIPAW_13G179100 [Carya illinoinensis]|uniref:Uncharacterized protein n=1 Tax=Carya illinoinensis TaxID=32201 RepID=A0A8T1NU67_CARIL|nr:hypothetical protein CIPAW_13G179100 [Carya illinoinensis]
MGVVHTGVAEDASKALRPCLDSPPRFKCKASPTLHQ